MNGCAVMTLRGSAFKTDVESRLQFSRGQEVHRSEVERLLFTTTTNLTCCFAKCECS